MKRTACVLLTGALALSLFAGCGKTEGPTAPEISAEMPAPTQPATEAPASTADTQPEKPQWDLWEKSSVEDRGTYPHSWDQRLLYGNQYLQDEILMPHFSQWLDDLEIIDSACVSGQGWVLMRGSPKGALDWKTIDYEGQPAYCRSLSLWVDRKTKDCRVGSSQPAIPVDFLTEENLYGPEIEENGVLFFPGPGKIIPPLSKAELYVRQLNQCFSITDTPKLQKLRKALTHPNLDNRMDYGRMRMESSEGYNPLILTLENGRQFQVATMPDGSGLTNVWDGLDLMMNESIFSLFGVPLKAEGYTQDADGNTVVTQTYLNQDYEPWGDWEETVIFTYSPDNNLMCMETENPKKRWDFETSRWEFTYDQQGRLKTETKFYDGQLDGSMEYEYNSNGSLSRRSFRDNSGKPGAYYTYEYDSQDRLLACIYHYPDGREGLPSGNSYYWYDEAGNRHPYRLDTNGNLEAGFAPETPVRRGE